jgi:hypothetical protein
VDFNQLAYRIVQESTNPKEPEPAEEPKTPAQRNGHKGGLKGGKARAEKLSADERSKIARKAARIRWTKEPAR